MKKGRPLAKKKDASDADKLDICPEIAPKELDKGRISPLKPIPGLQKLWMIETTSQKQELKHLHQPSIQKSTTYSSGQI